MSEQMNYMQRVGHSRCVRCDFETSDDMTFEQQDAAMMAHLADRHPNWMAEQVTAEPSPEPKAAPASEAQTPAVPVAAWRALMEEETKESIAKLYLDSLAELTALRVSHARLVGMLEEIERHHLELNRDAGRPANRSRTLRMCAAALIDARKLEGK